MAWLHGGISIVVCISTTGKFVNSSQVESVKVHFLIFFLCLQLTVTIKNDLGMTQQDVANSNIIALLAT